MPAITVTYDQVRSLRPSGSGLKSAAKALGGFKAWNAKPTTMADLQAAGVPYADLQWLACNLARENDDARRRQRLWGADCAVRVLAIYEKKRRSQAPRKAIIAARDLARGKISKAAADAAAADAAADADAAAAYAADAYDAAADAAAAARSPEEAWQADRLVAWFSDQEPEDWPLPELAELSNA